MEKKESKMIAGVAIILMILLHVTSGNLFEIKSVILDDVFVTAIARIGKICVSFFAFVSGYGLWKSHKECLKASWSIVTIGKEVLKRLLKFFKNYWPFVILGSVLNHIFTSRFSVAEFAKNAVGLAWTYNAAWWYIRYYVVIVIFIYPATIIIYNLVLKRLPENINRILIIMFTVLASIGCLVVGKRITGALCLVVFLSGEICAEWNIIKKIRQKRIMVVALFISGIALRMSYTNELGGLTLDLICVPMMIPAILELCRKIRWIGLFLYAVGIHSTTMWLMHSFIYMYSDWPTRFIFDGIFGWLVITALSWGIAWLWDNALSKLKKMVLKEPFF